MADVIDQGNERAEQFLAHSLAEAARAVVLPYKGYCYNCDDPLAMPHRYCDKDCRDDWQLRNPKC